VVLADQPRHPTDKGRDRVLSVQRQLTVKQTFLSFVV
jgi:hypothetical protein